jgi:hypothetical protein
MADVTITGLPNATTPLSGTERVPMDQGGVTRDAATLDIANLAGTAITAAVAAHVAAADPHPTYLTQAEGDVLYAAFGGGGGGGGANLSVANRGTSTLDIASDTGTDATLPAATTSLTGLMSSADKTKLDGIATAATANAADAALRDRATHTGTQAWSTITATPTTRSGYGITDSAANGAITGSGLTLATARLVGRTTAATGAPEEISVGASLSLSAGTLNLGATPALGTPASGTLTSCTGLPVSTGISGLGTGVATALAANTGSAGAPSILVRFGTATLGTTAIASGASATLVTVAATGVATTDVIDWGFGVDPNGATGYNGASTTGCLVITAYPTAGNVNFLVSNPTLASITPGALTLNWKVTR